MSVQMVIGCIQQLCGHHVVVPVVGQWSALLRWVVHQHVEEVVAGEEAVEVVVEVVGEAVVVVEEEVTVEVTVENA